MTNGEHVATEASLANVIRIDEQQVRSHVDELVRSTVVETLNGLLDAEADELCGAKRYARSPERLDTRSGHYQRKLLTKAGEVELKLPRLRSLPFETQIIERYRRRESSVEEALVEMYLAGVSVRRVEDITEALWGERVSPSAVSALNQKVYEQIERWRQRPLEGEQRQRTGVASGSDLAKVIVRYTKRRRQPFRRDNSDGHRNLSATISLQLQIPHRRTQSPIRPSTHPFATRQGVNGYGEPDVHRN